MSHDYIQHLISLATMLLTLTSEGCRYLDNCILLIIYFIFFIAHGRMVGTPKSRL